MVKNQRHGMLNPAAQYGAELTVGEVLEAREIVWPFTLQMCSPISDGAAAALLVSGERCAAGGPEGRGAGLDRPVRARRRLAQGDPAGGDAAYEAAGLGPADLDCVEVHDAAASAELVISEQLGLAGDGDGAGADPQRRDRAGRQAAGKQQRRPAGPRASDRRHRAGPDRRGGHPVAGHRGPRQVPQARVALTQNAGGWHGDDNVASVVHIFGRR